MSTNLMSLSFSMNSVFMEGKNGAHVMHLMQNLRMPIITVLHTVLSRPSEDQRIIIQELAKYSEFLVVMAHHAKTLLQDVYGIDERKITFIPMASLMFPLKEQIPFVGNWALKTERYSSPLAC